MLAPHKLVGTLLNFLVILSCSATGLAQELSTSSQESAREPAARNAVSQENTRTISAAERIAGLRKLLDTDQERRASLSSEVDRLEAAFQEASDRFTELDAQLKAAKAADTKANIASVEEKWTPARDHFERIIERRKAVQQQIKILDEKINLEQEALSRLESADGDVAKNAVSQAAIHTAKDATAKDSEKANTGEKTSDSKAAESNGTGEAAAGNEAASKLSTGLLKSEVPPTAPDDREMEAARELNRREAERDQLVQQVQLLERSIDVFERDLAIGEKLLQNAEAEAAAAKESHDRLAGSLAKIDKDDPSREDLERQLEHDVERLDAADKDLEKQRHFIAESQALLERMKQGRVKAQEKIKEAESVIAAARNRVWYLKSPFAPHRAVQWIATNGPRILAVVLFVLLARWISRLLGRRIVGAIVRRRGARGGDRDARAETLGRVFQNATGTAILIIGVLAIFDQMGVNVTVLLGGAAVIGAGVAFGSQNLIRDFFAGFMILVENQYSVGSVVKIGDVSGIVEDISLRTTVLRDEEGVVHFVPHGQITTVSNMTYSWSRAVLAIPVSYREDVDRVMQALLEVAQQMQDDPKYSQMILDEPEMLGVDALGDSGLVVKLLIKTRAMQQWNVKREALRRIKKRFDELNIEIPFPKREIHLVNASNNLPYEDAK